MSNDSANPTRLSAWLRCAHPNPGARLRLICFPYAGGSAGVYRTWGKLLSPAIEVCAVQLPGREDRLREQAFIDMNALIPALANALLPDLDKPFVFFGHSLGAAIAFALSQYLQSANQLLPRQLIVSGRCAPHLPNRNAPLYRLSDHDFFQQLRQRYGAIPDVIWQDQEMRAIYLPILRADFALIDRYCHQGSQKLTCPLIACGGVSDPMVTEAEIAAWEQHTENDFAMRMFAGDHFYLNQNPQPLLQMLEQQLSNTMQCGSIGIQDRSIQLLGSSAFAAKQSF